MHHTIEPAIHYWGTPVVLISTCNEDGSSNLGPMWTRPCCKVAPARTALTRQNGGPEEVYAPWKHHRPTPAAQPATSRQHHEPDPA